MAVNSYATVADLNQCGLPKGALDSIKSADQLAALQKASAIADGYMRDRYTLPLTGDIDPGLVDAVCQIAAYRLMALRGYNPASGADSLIRQGWVDATEWLKRVANGQVSLAVTQSQPQSLQPNVISDCPRGYEHLGPGTSGTGNWGI